MTTVSGESEARSCSAMTPSFICRRTAKSGSLVTGGAGDRRAARTIEARARIGPGRTPRDWLAGPGSIRGESGPDASSTVRDPDLPNAGPGRRRGEGTLELGAVEVKLLGDDRGVRLDDDDRGLHPGDAARPDDARDELGDQPVERGHRPRPTQLLVESELASSLRDQVADPDHRPASRGHREIVLRRDRGSGRDASRAPRRAGR